LQEKPQDGFLQSALFSIVCMKNSRGRFLQSASFNIICRKSPNTCGGSWLSFDIKLNA